MTLLGGCGCSGASGCPSLQSGSLRGSGSGLSTPGFSASDALSEWDGYDLSAILPGVGMGSQRSTGTWTSGGGYAYSLTTTSDPTGSTECREPTDDDALVGSVPAATSWSKRWSFDEELAAQLDYESAVHRRTRYRVGTAGFVRIWTNTLYGDGIAAGPDGSTGWVSGSWAAVAVGDIVEVGCDIPAEPPTPTYAGFGSDTTHRDNLAWIQFATSVGGGGC